MSVALALWSEVVSLWGMHRTGVLVVLLAILLIAVSNSRHIRRLGDLRPSGSRHPAFSPSPLPPSAPPPLVSLLVPARNEEGNIESCLRSLLAQEYDNYEVLLLDDESQDATWEIASRLAAADSRLRLLRGRPLPAGWLGKHWACWQLAEASRGDLLLFTDADTEHRPTMLPAAVVSQAVEEADLVSALPYQHLGTWCEKLVLPIMSWAMVALLPLGLAHRVRWPVLSGAIGQFMLFTRRAYFAMGGHRAVRDDVVDDMALARRTKACGFRWRLLDGSRQVECRMYRDARGVVYGFGRSIFPALGYRLWVMALIFIGLGMAFLEPAFNLAQWWLGAAFEAGTRDFIFLAVAVSLAPWLMAYHRFRQPFYLALLYPLTVAAVIAIGVHSAVTCLQGKATWKDRALAGGKVD